MKLRYLGTAAAEGWPALFCHCTACERARTLGGRNIRTRAQAVVNEELLLDFGPDTYLHVLRDGLKLPSIHTVLVTHSHQDHWYPQELLLRGEPYAHEASQSMLTVYGCAGVKAVWDWAVAQNDSPNIHRRVQFKEIQEFEPFTTVEGYAVTPLLAKHNRQEKCLFYLIERDQKRLLYAHDSGLFPEETWDYLAGKRLDAVSLDCTNVCDPDGSYHMGLPADAIAKRRLIELGCADERTTFIANHFSHNGRLMHDEIAEIAAKDGFLTSWDGMSVEF